jgi:DNA-binding transcriptional regulator YhcF (GntR family)
MPKKKRPTETPKKQFERFVETARELGVDEKKAERALKEVARPRKQPQR